MSESPLVRHLMAHWKDYACCVCGARKWSGADKLYEFREFRAGLPQTAGDGAIFAVVPLSCAVGGNTHFINAVTAGILSVGPPEQAPPAQSPD